MYHAGSEQFSRTELRIILLCTGSVNRSVPSPDEVNTSGLDWNEARPELLVHPWVLLVTCPWQRPVVPEANAPVYPDLISLWSPHGWIDLLVFSCRQLKLSHVCQEMMTYRTCNCVLMIINDSHMSISVIGCSTSTGPIHWKNSHDAPVWLHFSCTVWCCD